jgi:hypothetical protein
MIKVTEENAHKYHRYMWRWLARHVGYTKRDWPGWKRIRNSNSNCFACILADIRIGELDPYDGWFAHCSVCPIKEWREKVTLGRKNNEPACLSYESAFDRWESALNTIYLDSLATEISEMEWE